jgi:hypothetical protein
LSDPTSVGLIVPGDRGISKPASVSNSVSACADDTVSPSSDFPELPAGVFGLLTEDGKLLRDEHRRALRVETAAVQPPVPWDLRHG